MSKSLLMKIDPILAAKTIIEVGGDTTVAGSLLLKASSYNWYAKYAYDKIGEGNLYEAQKGLDSYIAATYPQNNDDISTNWILVASKGFSGCTGNVMKDLPIIAAAFGTTSLIAGPQFGSAALFGGIAAACFTGAYDSGDKDFLHDNNKIEMTGKSSYSDIPTISINNTNWK